MGKASRKQRKARTTQNQPVRHEQNEVVKSAPVNNVQEHRPSQWRQVVEEMAAAEKRAAAVQSAPAQPAKPVKSAKPAKAVKTVKAEGKARAEAEALLARAREKAGPAVKSALSAVEAAWEKICILTGDGWDRAGCATARVRRVIARHPVSPLLYATLLAVTIGVVSFQGMYTQAYVLEVDGQEVGILANEEDANAILTNVETRAASILGDDYSYDPDISLTPVYAVPDALSDTAQVEDMLFDEVGALMEAYAISVDGEELGCAATKEELYQLLDEIAQPYLTGDATRYEFVENVQIYPVELPSNTQFDIEPIRTILTALEVEEAVYVVEKGDTFNAIAYSLDMMPNELSILNPDVIVNKLWVGQELVIQQAVPYLSVRVTADETYEAPIESPIEYIDTADLYVGSTKVKEQGEDGLALVNAKVTYVNGAEVEREILESTTLKEATTTYVYNGTTPRPATASNGYFIWPVRGTITSYFGGRNLWGSYDFHLGLDIACRYGTPIKAADGGTVIKAGWNGSYGILVALRHDDGTVTYYGHNSSALVSVGQKVYQGQTIALAGSTGNSSGPHCDFEVRINGTSVNPRNYLQ